MNSFEKTVMAMMVALVFSGLAASQAMAQPYDEVVNINFMREGVQPYTNTNGVGAAVDSGTIWNDLEVGNGPVGPQVFNNLTDSNGNATFVVLNNNWRFISNNAGAPNNLNKGYFYHGQFIVGGGINEVVPYSIDGLEVGRDYDLFFYLGNDPATSYGGTPAGISVDATGGVVSSDSDSGSGYTPGHSLAFGSPTHANWTEGIYYEKLTVTTTATTVSGEFILGDSGDNINGDNRFFGMQIARVEDPNAPPVTDFTWNAASGDWNDPNNWLPNGPPANATHKAIFGDTIGNNARTVFTDTSVTVNAIDFNNTMGGSYHIAGGGSINLDTDPNIPNPTIQVVAGSHEFQAPVNLDADTTIDVASGAFLEFNHRLNLNGNTHTKDGGGTLAISNDVVTGGGTINGLAGTIAGSGTIGGDVTISGATLSPGSAPVVGVSVSSVPEPGGILLMGLGLLVLSLAKRMRR